MRLHGRGIPYTRYKQKSSSNVQFSGHFLGSIYRTPYSETAHLPHEKVHLKFRSKSDKTSI